MKQPINGYHKDSENHWVAELACGHGQHVRHDPPWMERPWVTTEEGRQSRLGTELNCVRCDEMGKKVAEALLDKCQQALTKSFDEAGVSGLCVEGRWEAAIGAIKSLELHEIIESALKEK